MLVASISSSFTAQIASHGVYAVFGLMAIGAVLPIGSELVMLYAGAVAAGVYPAAHGVTIFGARVGFGGGALVTLALAGTLGYLAGSAVGWGIGRLGGRALLERHGRWLHLTPERLDRGEEWFVRWGRPGVVLGSVTPVVRSFVAIPAGILEMPFATYLVLALAGSAIWSFALGGAGYALGASYRSFDHGFHYAEYAIVAGLVLAAAYLVYRRIAAAKVTPNADDSPR